MYAVIYKPFELRELVASRLKKFCHWAISDGICVLCSCDAVTEVRCLPNIKMCRRCGDHCRPSDRIIWADIRYQSSDIEAITSAVRELPSAITATLQLIAVMLLTQRLKYYGRGEQHEDKPPHRRCEVCASNTIITCYQWEEPSNKPNITYHHYVCDGCIVRAHAYTRDAAIHYAHACTVAPMIGHPDIVGYLIECINMVVAGHIHASIPVDTATNSST